MKTIIISDIKSNKDSIMTYGLRLAKQLETDVEVIHPIDPRVHQGAYGAVSDSQSVTPGTTFSHEEAISREIEGVKKDLDKFLSAEASRLNYPLKVDVKVEEESIDEAIKASIEKYVDCIFVTSTEPDGSVFQSKNEILETIKNNHAISVIVPPKISFSTIRKIYMPVDFSSSIDATRYKNIDSFITKTDPFFVAIDVAINGNYAEKELKSQTWIELANKFFTSSKLTANTLKGDSFIDTIADYTNRNKPDLMILTQKKQSSLKEIISKDKTEKLFHKLEVPVLIHYY